MPAPTPLPGPLRLEPAFPFVGRPRELVTLEALVPWAPGEGRRIALVGGEAGSGKSRLVREFAHRAAAGGATVLYGGCDAVVPTPYRPFAEALAGLVRDGGAAPELAPMLGTAAGGRAVDQDTIRHRLHTAVGDLLTAASRRAPVVLVLEDGHWADGPSLLLLRHLSRAATDARLLVVATFRDTGADVPEDLAAALVDLRRTEGVAHVRLAGLDAEEIAELLALASGGRMGAGLAAVAAGMHDLTGGNPFLVIELWRSLLDTGELRVVDGVARLRSPLASLRTPASVREVVTDRLARLAPRTREVLELAAVSGQEFEPGLVAAAAGVSDDVLLEEFDRAAGAGMIEPIAGAALLHRFTHELVRRALYDGLTAGRRARLHLRVGEALEADPDAAAPALLAHHFVAAAPLGGAARAVGYSLRAARLAIEALAFEEAVAPLRAAIELGAPAGRDRAERLLELGGACFRAGRLSDAERAFGDAAEAARGAADSELMARAAIGYESSGWRMGNPREGARRLMQEAAAALGGTDSRLRIEALVSLGRSHAQLGDHVQSEQFGADAIAMARELGDRPGLAMALTRSYWLRQAAPPGETLALLTEGRDLAAELGDDELLAEAMLWRIAVLIGVGDLVAARREADAVLELAGRTRQPFMLHVAEQHASTIALCDGRLEEAEAAAGRSREWGALLTGRDASGGHGVQMFGIRREQGRLAELAPIVRILAGDRESAWRPGLAALLAELGMADEARVVLDELRAAGLEALRQGLWLAGLTYTADACAAVGYAPLAHALYEELLPHAGSIVVVGHSVACYGSADRYLGMLAVLTGDAAAAEGHFEAALAANRTMGAATFTAHTAYEYGRFLAIRRGADRERAAQLLAEAADVAERIGMRALAARVAAVGVAAPRGRVARADGMSEREVEILALVARGLSNRDIGAELVISEHTVANHVRAILRKTGCTNRTEAAAYAHEHGLRSDR